MKAPKDFALLSPACLPCAQPGPRPSHPAEVGRPIKSRRWLQCNILRHGQAQFPDACDIVATVLVRRDPVLTRFPGPVQGSAATGGIGAKGIEAAPVSPWRAPQSSSRQTIECWIGPRCTFGAVTGPTP